MVNREFDFCLFDYERREQQRKNLLISRNKGLLTVELIKSLEIEEVVFPLPL